MTSESDRSFIPFQQRLLKELLVVQPKIKIRRAGSFTRRKQAVAAIAAAAVAVLGVMLPAQQDGRPNPAAKPESLFLSAQVSEAVENTEEKILHTFETSSSPGQPEMRFEGWWDQGRGHRTRTVQLDEFGNPVSESIFRVKGDQGVLVHVDHATGTWWTRNRNLNLGDGKVAAFAPEPASIRFRDEIAEGEIDVIGQENLDGRELIHVRDNSKPGMQRDMWVFLDTYLPVRRITTDQFGNRFEMTFEWLPRNESNLRLLEADLSGMKQIDPPQEAAPSSDGGLG
ncbi:MAG TPA: hypothetical protein VND22_07855 [Actinomycetota bacterium]|nr:hypothetical protein [Actinomycetota bacterium]